MPLNLPSQEKWICKGGWTKDLFTSIVLRHAKEMKYSSIIGVPRWFIQAVYDELNAESGGKNFSVQEMKERMRFYKARYDTLKVLVANNKVQWVPNLQLVTAVDEVLLEMIEQNPFVAFYYQRDEPMLNELTQMFGLHDVKVEPPTEVIQISSEVDKEAEEDGDDEDDWFEQVEGDAIDLSYKVEEEEEEEEEEEKEEEEVDEDEVNSPVLNKDKQPRRKLFVDPTTLSALSDRLSTTMPPPNKHKQPSKLYPMDLPRPSRYSPGVSSCASSSPASKAPRGPHESDTTDIFLDDTKSARIRHDQYFFG